MKSGTMAKIPPANAPARPDDAGGLKDDDQPKPTKPAAPASLARAVIVAAALISVSYAAVRTLTDRYLLVAPAQSGNAFIYRIDRLTGGVAFCTQNSCTPVGTRSQGN